MTRELKVELANKIGVVGGRACVVGNLWGVALYVDGRRTMWLLPPQEDEARARAMAARGEP